MRRGLGDAAPFAGGGHRAGVGAESDEWAIVGVPFAHQLPQRQLTIRGDFGRAGVADVRVLRPHHNSRWLGATLTVQVCEQGRQGLRHVLVTQIPRRDPPAEHCAVIGLAAHHAALGGPLCRVLIRTRARLRHPGEILAVELAGPVTSLMTRGMLLGIKRRSENLPSAPYDSGAERHERKDLSSAFFL